MCTGYPNISIRWQGVIVTFPTFSQKFHSIYSEHFNYKLWSGEKVQKSLHASVTSMYKARVAVYRGTFNATV